MQLFRVRSGENEAISPGLVLAGLVAHDPAAACLPRTDSATAVALNRNPAAATADDDLLPAGPHLRLGDVDVAAAAVITTTDPAVRRRGLALLRHGGHSAHGIYYRRLLTDFAAHLDADDLPSTDGDTTDAEAEFLMLSAGLSLRDAWRVTRRISGAEDRVRIPLLLSYAGAEQDHPWRISERQLRWRLRRFAHGAGSDAAVRLTEHAASHRKLLHHLLPHRDLKAHLDLAYRGGPQKPAESRRHEPRVLSEEFPAATRSLLFDVDCSPDPTSYVGETQLQDPDDLHAAAKVGGPRSPAAIERLTEEQVRATIGRQSPTRQLFWGQHLTRPCPALDVVAETFRNLHPTDVATRMGLHEARALARTLRRHYGEAILDLDQHADARGWQHPARVAHDPAEEWPWMANTRAGSPPPTVDLTVPLGELHWDGGAYGKLPERLRGTLSTPEHWRRLAHHAATYPHLPLSAGIALTLGDA